MGPDQPPHERPGDGPPPRARSFRRSRAAGQRLALAGALTSVVALSACQWFDGDPPASAREQLNLAPAAPGDAYPSLHSVPPRAQLSYSVEQRRAIVDGLIADRENARYTDQVVRYRSGQSSLPPPPAPPHDVAAVDTEGLLEPDPAAQVEDAADEQPPLPSPFDDDAGLEGAGDEDDEEDTLDSFVDELATDPVAEQADDAGVPAAPAPAAPAATDEEDGQGFMDWLGDLLGQTEPAAPAPATALAAVPAMQPVAVAQSAAEAETAERAPDGTPPRPEPGGHGIAIGVEGVAIERDAAGGSRRSGRSEQAGIERAPAPTARDSAPGKPEVPPLPPVAAAGRIPFEPGSADLPEGASAHLEQVLAEAKAQGAVIRILGEAAAPALALDRARAVGLALVRLGAGAGDLEMTLAHGATGDQAQLLLARPDAR
jgi:hypothetical protein